MKYTQSPLYREELQAIRDVLELINYRPRTIDSYLQSVFECCLWLEASYDICLNDADVPHLRTFLLHLKRNKEDGGLGYAPRSVNIYNCALKKYFRFVLRRPLTNDDLPLCRVDHPLPKVPSKPDVMTIIIGTKNIRHMAALAVAYGAALRLSDVAALRFGDISFTDGIVTISEDVSKSRYAGKVELFIFGSNFPKVFPRYRPRTIIIGQIALDETVIFASYYLSHGLLALLQHPVEQRRCICPYPRLVLSYLLARFQ